MRQLYLHNPGARAHLVKAGIVAPDLRVLGGTSAIRQGAKVSSMRGCGFSFKQGFPSNDVEIMVVREKAVYSELKKNLLQPNFPFPLPFRLTGC